MKDSWHKYAVVANRQEQTGLCSTCDHQSVCCHVERASQPILHCEEFFAYAPPPARAVTQVCAQAETGGEAQHFTGLCVNCDHRLDCKNAGCEGGIWHCEEYR